MVTSLASAMSRLYVLKAREDPRDDLQHSFRYQSYFHDFLFIGTNCRSTFLVYFLGVPPKTPSVVVRHILCFCRFSRRVPVQLIGGTERIEWQVERAM